ncbi:aspartate aminotransferase family protein [candidate division BRC1 bacterium HGW-BRC1-1]|jgi:acetylornithine/succinyldiaminopimelate/putrescine aminotransferase|nr:MAG: aspartate aminotransferase family protein [candidate division BRC1 bacterium HGW-BRC1-1]
MKGEPVALKDSFLKHVAQTSPFSHAFPVARAEGCRLWDTDGKQYLDFVAGIAVTNVGHCHPEVVEAVCRQAHLYAHTMVYGEHVQEPQVQLAEAIARVAPEGMDCTYFLTTGAEANDAALKLAVKLTGRSWIVAFHKAYHGDTLGALACFGEERFRHSFEALLKPVDFLPFGDFDALERITAEHAAVLVEPVQGEAGIRLPPPNWLVALRERCDQTGAMLIFDEVQTGFGRLGEWFAAGEWAGATPDVMTVAKGMGAGMPLAGVIAPRDMLWRFAADPPFSHITTFGGHPVSCAAGLAAMKVIEREGLLARARECGDYLRDHLRDIAAADDQLVDVRGAGQMTGVEFASEKRAREVVTAAMAEGLLLETNLMAEDVVRFSPPLTATRAECDEAIEKFAKALKS